MKSFIRILCLSAALICIYYLCAIQPVSAGPIPATVTIQSSVGPISKNIWGVDFQSLINVSPTDFSTFLATYITQGSLSSLGAKMLRFPGGCASTYYDWQSTPSQLVYTDVTGVPIAKAFFSIGDALTIAGINPGSDILYQVNITDQTMQNLITSCNTRSQRNKTSAELMTELSALVTQFGASIHYYEIGTDQWTNWPTAEYSVRALQAAHTIKAIDPNAKIGVLGYPGLAAATARKNAWNSMITNLVNNTYDCGIAPANNKACFDFVTDHQYPQAKSNPNFLGQAAFYPITNLQTQLPVFQAPYPGKEYNLTEWNLACDPGNAGVVAPMANTVDQGIFTFTSLFVMAQNKVGIANFHDLSVNVPPYACGLFTGSTTFSPAGQAFALSAVAAGGELIDAKYAFPNNNGFICLPDNAACTDADCIKGSAPTCLQDNSGIYSVMSSYAARQGNDLYIFLVNRSDAAAADPITLNTTITYGIWPGYDTPPKQVLVDILSAPGFTSPTFTTNSSTLPPQTTGQLPVINLPPTSITRIRIIDHFFGAPSPTPTGLVHPTNNLTIIRKLINMKRTDLIPCTQDLMLYIVASAVYIMVIHFAIATNINSQDFKMNLHISCFIIGGIIGYYLCHLDVGFVLAIVLSLFLW